jgi:predicted P-loop ATPase
MKKLSKDIILAHTKQENIFLHFLNLTTFPTGNISSPFTKDENASFKLYKNGSYKCNSSGKQGDVFQFIADFKNLDCKNQFQEVLQIIATEMNLLQLIGNSVKTGNKKANKQTNTSVSSIATIEKPKNLIVEKRDFSDLDLAYWNKLGVNKSILEKFKVHSISSSGFEPNKLFRTKDKTVSFAYEINGLFKKYTPEQPEQNTKKSLIPHLKNVVFGLEQLPAEKIENLIICEGEKDVIIASSRGLFAVTFGSATNNPTTEQIATLQNRCKTLFVCYDNDKAGETGRNDLIKGYNKIVPLQLPTNDKTNGYDVTDYFQEHTVQDFQKIIDLAVKNKNIVDVTPDKEITTIIHITEDYLNEHYKIRHNIIANEIEISKQNVDEWNDLNENSLWIEMQKKSIKVPASTLEKILKSDFVPKFNPLIDYFENLPVWDKKTDYITQYSDYITLEKDEDKQQYNYHFKKWCVRAVKCATNDNYFNKNAFVISDEGKGQNIGKTTWIRNLCPQILSNYLKDDLPKDEKDAKIALTQNFIVNLDELASLSRQEINTLKSLFSADKIKVRFPYDKKEIVVRRVANFIGSTNLSTFLHDETGSVRWLCFVADTIDFSYKTNFDINNLWAQAFALSNDINFDETITSKDMALNELRNAKFQMQSPEKDLINQYLELPNTIDETEILSSTEIQHYLSSFANSIKLNNVALGKALTSLKYRKIRSSTSTKYAVKKKDLSYN